MNRKDLATARSFKHLVQKRVHPLDIRVFGSRARGDAAPDSDLDVFVVVEHATSDIDDTSVIAPGRPDLRGMWLSFRSWSVKTGSMVRSRSRCSSLMSTARALRFDCCFSSNAGVLSQ